jgi:energy-coupling factor transport system substrate-specific component
MASGTDTDIGNLPVLVLCAACIALNVAIGSIVYLLKLPIYLDVIGVMAAALLVPGSRLSAFGYASVVGVITVLLGGLLVNPFLPWFMLTAIACAAYGAYVVRGRVDELADPSAPASPTALSIVKVVALGIGWGVVAALVSAPVVVYLFGGVTGSGTSLLVAFFAKTGHQLLQSALLSGLTAEPVDKTIQLFCAIAIARATPRAFLRTLGSAQA